MRFDVYSKIWIPSRGLVVVTPCSVLAR